jgi:biuret amidohydrolase
VKDSVSALIIVDMQNYYLKTDSPYHRYFTDIQPGCLDYIRERCETVVVPNIRRLIDRCRDMSIPVLFLRLCGKDPDRADLHRFFKELYQKAKLAGYDNVYPLENDPYADMIEELRPLASETVINKTTFSPFTSTDIDAMLKRMGVDTLIFTGLSTSQCVETTARDASDRGYRVVHIEDAQADYDEISHTSSLYSSQGVCGGIIATTEEFIMCGMPEI